MQSKLLTAAALASSVTALKIQAPITNLAQSESQQNECKGTYAYQCIEEKVEKALGNMEEDVQAKKEECLEVAQQLKQDIAVEIKAFRESIMKDLEDLRLQQVSNIAGMVDTAKSNMTAVVDNVTTQMNNQINAELDGSSRAAVERKKVENELKKLYYGDGNGMSGAHQLKARMAEKVEGFKEWVEEGNHDLENMRNKEMENVEDVMEHEMQVINTAIVDTQLTWHQALEKATTDLNEQIEAKFQQMDLTIGQKSAEIKVIVENLTENFIIVYWDTIEEIYQKINYYERQGLIWKALYQKDQFLGQIGDISYQMLNGLATARTEMVEEVNPERDALAAWIEEQREEYQEKIVEMTEDAALTMEQQGENVFMEAEEMMKLEPDHNEALTKFVFDMANIRLDQSGYGSGTHGEGFQPYAKLVVARLEKLITKFGESMMDTFDASAIGAMDTTMATLSNEKAGLTTDSSNNQMQISQLTEDLLLNLTMTRESTELALTDWQTSQEEQDQEKRDLDEIELVSVKNKCWKELSWIIRRTHAGYQYGGDSGLSHEHGLSAGPIYGFLQNGGNQHQSHGGHAHSYAQIEPINQAKVEAATGGYDDGYDPYGYGDFGYGYGYAQVQYKEIQEKLKEMETAVKDIVHKNEYRIKTSEKALKDTQDAATQAWISALEVKQNFLIKAMADQSQLWEQQVAARTIKVMEAIEKCKEKIGGANTDETDTMDSKEKELRWAITSIYNYETQDRLNKALTKARGEMNDMSGGRMGSLMATLDDVQATWEQCVIKETDAIKVNTEEEAKKCYEANVSNSEILDYFKEDQTVRFYEWAEEERNQLTGFVEKCEEAWQWILVSYCLSYDKNGDISNAGYGCTWGGTGSGYGNGGFNKGINIEKYDEILTHGQELSIKHIPNLDELVAHATNYALDGTPQEFYKLFQHVIEKSAEYEQQINATRELMQASMHNKKTDLMQVCDDFTDQMEQDLTETKDGVLEAVTEDRIKYENAVDDKREQVLWEVKELVWRLGYTQGYHYGAHDGHDTEIIAQITQKKNEFEQLVQNTLQMMQDRVNKEQEDGDAGNTVAIEEFQKEMEKVTQEMEETMPDIEEALGIAKKSIEDEIQTATDKFEAIIEDRIANWAAKAEYEEINAKWQEDSYYRYGLIKLLQAKNESIDAAIADAKSSFKTAMNKIKAEAVTFRGEQREAFRQFTEYVRHGLVDAINEDDSNMEQMIETRVSDLDKELENQQHLLEYAMETDRLEMKKRLEEIYQFNSYDWDKSRQVQNNSSAPYSHEQHQAFLHKFAYYLKDVLRNMDAALVDMKQAYASSTTTLIEECLDQNDDLQIIVDDQRFNGEKELSRKATALLQAFADTQDTELDVLVEARTAAEEFAQSETERLKKDIIYSMHVVRYAGGKDLGDFGFGNAASSYYGKGNSLTGIDELDLWQTATMDTLLQESTMIYAQVNDVMPEDAPHGSQIHGTEDHSIPYGVLQADEHHKQLQEMLADAKQGFNNMLNTSKLEFATLANAEKAECIERRSQVNTDLTDIVNVVQFEQGSIIAVNEADFAEANSLKQQKLIEQTEIAVEAFYGDVDAQLERTTGWFDDKLEWANKLYDSAYKTHLLNELMTKRESTVTSLEKRKAQARADADNAILELTNGLNAEEEDLAASNLHHAQAMSGYVQQLMGTTDAAAGATESAFTSNVQAEEDAMSLSADVVAKDWAFWLKYFYGFAPYEQSMYDDYDDTADYSGGLGLDSLNDADGPGGQHINRFGGTGVSSSGFYYKPVDNNGGVGDHDHLFPGGDLGLAHGKEIGPNNEFFDTGSIFNHPETEGDKEDEEYLTNDLMGMMMLYSATYSGLDY